MGSKKISGNMKHFDFILIDILCLQGCFIAAYWYLRGFGNPYAEIPNQYLSTLMFICQLLTILFSRNYSGILRRGNIDEFFSVIKHISVVLLLSFAIMFMAHNTQQFSRLQVGFTALFYIIADLIFRTLNKNRIKKRKISDAQKKHICIFTYSKELEYIAKNIPANRENCEYAVSIIILIDSKDKEKTEYVVGDRSVPVYPMGSDAVYHVIHDWIDEVIIIQSPGEVFPDSLVKTLLGTGMPVGFTLSLSRQSYFSNVEIRQLGEYKIFRTGKKLISPEELLAKRVFDIIGSIFGCILTGIISVFVVPAIYFADPGPVIFTQTRIGQNGKKFKIHKFRSMYMDAEKRKKELAKRNQINDGMMFKVDDDPRIIGSEKKDKNGHPCGIGNFIRKTSIDELPQFFDVLTGKMSLVGWRPCTLDEWIKYGVDHRIRASMKPGLTGMWQVSGRSDITDFSEVVKLDMQYIEKWSLLLDIKIILKTIYVVLTGRGAK